MFPSTFPHNVKVKRKLAGEKLAFDALEAGLDGNWAVFYDRPMPGTPRRVDFIAVAPGQGVLAIEVKGGMVHASRGAFRQRITKDGWRKRIDPFGQLKMAFARVCDVAGVDMSCIPVHFVVWFLEMAAEAFTWAPSPHIWTREMCAPGAIAAAVALSLSEHPYRGAAGGVAVLLSALKWGPDGT